MSDSPWSRPVDDRLPPALRDCIEAAVAAPSLHNSQPWRFRVGADGLVDVLVDHSRRLGVIDPQGREAMISVGAAILNLRVALLAHGRLPVLRLLPSPAEPSLAARVAVGRPIPIPETARLLARAIPLRRTNRRPFTRTPVPKKVLADLADAAGVEGGTLVLGDRADRDWLMSLVRTAEERRRADPQYCAELARWTVRTSRRLDGIPPEAYGPLGARDAVPLRDFGLVRRARRRAVRMFEADPTVAVLYSAGDAAEDWLRAGQALQRTLLTATVHGVSSTLMTQPLEFAELRAHVAGRGAGGRPQAIVRFGYGPPSPPTPRRPLDAVVELCPTVGAEGPRQTEPCHRAPVSFGSAAGGTVPKPSRYERSGALVARR